MGIRWVTLFLDFPASTFDRGVAFWTGVTGTRTSAARGPSGEFATLLPAHGDAYLRVQRVADGDGGCHLDLHVESVAAAAERAQSLGARVRHREPGLVVAESPGGFVFCLVDWRGEKQVPDPVDVGGGQSRADQLCLDIPADLHEAEVGFWAALLGWSLRAGSLPEFAYLDRPDDMPLRLLFQRRAASMPGDRVRGHVDLAGVDVDTLVKQHVAAGAQLIDTYPNWLAMLDPTGRPYCLTRRDPYTGRLPTR